MRKKYTEIEKKLMKDMAYNLRTALKKKNISQKDLAGLTGLSTSAISDYINAKTLMSPGNVQIISDSLNLEKNEIDPTFRGSVKAPDTVDIPILKSVFSQEDMAVRETSVNYHSEYEVTPRSWVEGGEYFYVISPDDSMVQARINEGDLLLVRKQNQVVDGEIAAVAIEGQIKIKRVYNNDKLVLQSENQNYPLIMANKQDQTIRVIGKVTKVVFNL